MTANIAPESSDFSRILIRWYHRHHRDLPWRHTCDPYKIWLSEIILQQTRVAQGMPYYLRFAEQYPTVFDLARADEQEVLRLWQGLGYYSRARNMHRTARQVADEYGGAFPPTYAELLKLKGVGHYTAAAIASFAFGEAVPAVDGNVFRVLARIFGIKTDILSSPAKKEFTEVARHLIPADDPATFNQAMIEFGAIQCQPVAPDCLLCPFNALCYAFQHGAQKQLPVKSKKAKVRDRYLNYLILEKNGQLAMRQRTARDVWQGLFDFVLVESPYPVDTADQLTSYSPTALEWLQTGRLALPQKTYVHLLSHQKLHVRFWHVHWDQAMGADKLPEEFAFYDRSAIENLPKPILIDTFIKEQIFN